MSEFRSICVMLTAMSVAISTPKSINAWQQWVHRPQTLWIRRALFQVHLWIGIGIGAYIFLISISGSAVVYRRELTRKFVRHVTVAVSGTKLSTQELGERTLQLYPGYKLAEVYQPRRPELPASIVLERGKKRLERLVDPYTGADLGDPESRRELILEWLVDFHDNLLAGRTGRFWNGIGSILATLLALTGMFVWWPGIKNWRRSMTINWKASFPRFNWDLHSAVGFWCSLLVLIWAVSGIYFSFPDPFNPILGEFGTLWLSRLHFGRFNPYAEVIWTILGLAPALLFVTGFLMWWKRVVRKGVRQSP